MLTTPPRARIAYDIVTNNIRNHTGIESNLGKTKCWSSGVGPALPGVAELGVVEDADIAEHGVVEDLGVEHTAVPVWEGNLE